MVAELELLRAAELYFETMRKMLLLFVLVSLIPSSHAATNGAECQAEHLHKLLIMKMETGDASNLMRKRWWYQCPLSVRRDVWSRVTIVPSDPPSWQLGTSVPLPYLGIAPEFLEPGPWHKSDGFSLYSKRGDVVLIHFWTQGCINCIHALPKIQKLHERYGLEKAHEKRKLVVVGVHAPEFAYERSQSKVADAIERHSLSYPNFQDNAFLSWNEYGNQYWPGLYLIDSRGNLRYTHFGEGAYEETERAVRELLRE